MAETQKKIQAINDFIIGLADIRRRVKEDARLMLAAIPLDILDNQTALTEYLEEMARAISRKYLITQDNKRIVTPTAKLINKYVNAMLKRG